MAKEWIYALAYDDGDMLIRYNDSDNLEEFAMERYDGKDWVEDFEMAGIFSGDIPVRVLEEEEAMKIVEG